MIMKKHLVVLTGAGMSAESGFSTFRDAGGLWDRYPVEKVATPEGFEEDPNLVLGFYRNLRNRLYAAAPNAGHLGLVELEKDFDVDIITQNVDNFHERAGSRKVLHLHGELTKICSSRSPNDSRMIRELPPDAPYAKVGDLAPDGSQLRPFIVWFGEAVPEIEKAASIVRSADIFVVIGPSLNVYPAAGLLGEVPKSAKIYLIDPKPVDTHTRLPITVFREKASSGVRRLIETLRTAGAPD